MFRRFMIVCWVLFGMLFAVTFATYYGSYHYAVQASQIIEAAQAASDREAAKIVAEGGVAPEWMTGPIVETRESRAALIRSESLTDLGLPAAILTVFVLVWNVIWHVGHWTWMGREAHK